MKSFLPTALRSAVFYCSISIYIKDGRQEKEEGVEFRAAGCL
jgi:hypothetical protein